MTNHPTRDGWTIVASAPLRGLWRVSAHRSDPDGWAMLPGRWGTEDQALAAAEAWLPTVAPYAPAAAAPPAAEPDEADEADEDPEPQPAVALPGQLDLFGARR
tara:strand:+ start:360 stop:668 length:309 start_codon:yes stop_codon:yes gene_type:complete